MNPETRWLLDLLRGDRLPSPAEPAPVIEAVKRQRVPAWVRYRWRCDHGGDPHWDLDGILQRAELDEHVRRTALDAALAEVVGVANAGGHRHMIVKGQASARFYPDPWLRPQSDVDVLVDPEHFRPLAKSLSAHGFALVGDDPSNPTELALRELSSGVQVELHNGFSFDPDVRFERLWNERQEVELCGRTVAVLADLDALILSVLHAVGGHLCRNALPWLLDTVLVLEHCEQESPGEVPQRFRQRLGEAGWRGDAWRHLDLVAGLLNKEEIASGGGAAPVDLWAAMSSLDQKEDTEDRGFAQVWLWERYRKPDTRRYRARRVGKLFWPSDAECRRRFPGKSRSGRRLAHYGEVARFFAGYARDHAAAGLKAGFPIGLAAGVAGGAATMWPDALGWLVLVAFVPVLLFLTRRRSVFELAGVCAGVVLPWTSVSLGGFLPVLASSLGIHPLVAAIIVLVMISVGTAWLAAVLALWPWLLRRSDHTAWTMLVPVLAGAWLGVTEWLRGLVTAPWSEIAYPLIGVPILAAPVRWLTLNGLSAVVIALAGYAALALAASTRVRRRAALAGFAVLLVTWFASGMMGGGEAGTEGREPLEILVVQPGFPTADKYDPVLAAQQVEDLIALTEDELARQPSIDLVVWPESAINFNYADPPSPELDRLFTKIRHALQPYPNVHLLTGIVRLPGDGTRFNAAFLFDHRLEVVGHYDRRTLIPIGEYTPFYLPGIFGRPGIRSSPFTPGAEDQGVLHVGGYTLGLLICHEGLFPGYAQAYSRLGADLILNIGNDEIFGSARNPLLAMHINHTRFRALESGIPVVRVFNSGPSGLLLPDGSRESILPFEVSRAHTATVVHR